MADYAYSNARIRAMEGRLLNRGEYESLLGCASFDGLVEVLKSSRYAHPLALALTGYDPTRPAETVVRIDEVLRRNLTQNLTALRRFFSDRSGELINELFLRWDVYSLKTVLRGKQAGAPVEEVLAATLPVGELDDIALGELARAPTMQAMAHLLETWRHPLAHPVRTGLNLLGATDSLEPLEHELNRFTVAHTSRLAADGDDDDRAVRDYLLFLGDKANLLTGLRCLAERTALSPFEAGRHFLKAGGRFTRTHYEAIVNARDTRDGLAWLAGTPYSWLADAFSTFSDGEPISLPLVERKLDLVGLRKAVGLSRPDPLGIGPAILYIEQTTNQVRNIRMILRGKALGMQNDQIEEWLILWPA
ncbi:MAG: V-type ATPase subunit [Nitrospira sp.]|nr:V-type ATPase subunit [Nitrospira sp.]